MKRDDVFKGKYLAVSDLDGQDWLVTIRAAKMEDVGTEEEKESKLILYFEKQDRGIVCNPTNWDTIEALHGEDTVGWIGKNITLFTDPTVKYKGKRTGGIRVRPEIPAAREPGVE